MSEPTEFDLGAELAHFHDPGHELYGLSERVFFYLIQTCRFIESFAEPSASHRRMALGRIGLVFAKGLTFTRLEVIHDVSLDEGRRNDVSPGIQELFR
jgi:hypothetical protein